MTSPKPGENVDQVRITRASSLVEIAFVVCTALDRVGVNAVLTGGSAATYWAPNKYQSQDLDYVITMGESQGGTPALAAIGFVPKGQTYVHPDTRFTLDFPDGPLSVGDDLIDCWETIRRQGEILHVLSATDCTRDRLAAWLFWSDRQSLTVAVNVALENPTRVDLPLIEDWCKRERELDKYAEFARQLERRR